MNAETPKKPARCTPRFTKKRHWSLYACNVPRLLVCQLCEKATSWDAEDFTLYAGEKHGLKWGMPPKDGKWKCEHCHAINHEGEEK